MGREGGRSNGLMGLSGRESSEERPATLGAGESGAGESGAGRNLERALPFRFGGVHPLGYILDVQERTNPPGVVPGSVSHLPLDQAAVMTIEIIIVLIGLMLVLPAIIGTLASNSGGAGPFGPTITIVMAVLGVGLLLYGGFAYGVVTQRGQLEVPAVAGKLQVEHPVQRVHIISPLDGEAVPCRVLTMGVYPQGHDKDIWVLLRPTDNMLYPQSDHTNTSFKRNGEWQVITRYGGSLDENYEVIVFEADAAASQFFTATLEEWKADLFFPGLTDEEMPAGATELDRITVTLAENCRGVF